MKNIMRSLILILVICIGIKAFCNCKLQNKNQAKTLPIQNPPTTVDSLQGSWRQIDKFTGNDLLTESIILSINGRNFIETYKSSASDLKDSTTGRIYFSDTLVNSSIENFEGMRIDTTALSGKYLILTENDADRTIRCYEIFGFNIVNGLRHLSLDPIWAPSKTNVYKRM